MKVSRFGRYEMLMGPRSTGRNMEQQLRRGAGPHKTEEQPMSLIFRMPNANGRAGTLAALSERGSYDSAGFVNQLPGYGAFERPDSAPGSDGVSPGATAGAVVGNPVVSSLYGSSQVPANVPTVPVTSGATSGVSDDQPVHDGTPMLAGGDVGNNPSETGSGRGSFGHFAHPNNANSATGSIQ
jgi:hypothetical protein